jgi:hypothetical protein
MLNQVQMRFQGYYKWTPKGDAGGVVFKKDDAVAARVARTIELAPTFAPFGGIAMAADPETGAVHLLTKDGEQGESEAKTFLRDKSLIGLVIEFIEMTKRERQRDGAQSAGTATTYTKKENASSEVTLNRAALEAFGKLTDTLKEKFEYDPKI